MVSQQPRSYTRLATAIVVAALVIGAAIYASSYAGKTTIVTNTSTVTATTTVSNTTGSALLAGCVNAPTPDLGFGTVTAGMSSPALVCVQLYYYNSTAPLTENITKDLLVYSLQTTSEGNENVTTTADAASNFSISPSQFQLVIGGPTNESEGTVVAYAITAKEGASGAYQLGFGGMLLTAKNPETCNYFGQLVAGNGKPDYAQYINCVYFTPSAPSSTVPGISYPLTDGDVYFRIIGVINSTS
jgi:hypothetical protein